jgi:hypothetical protein
MHICGENAVCGKPVCEWAELKITVQFVSHIFIGTCKSCFVSCPCVMNSYY